MQPTETRRTPCAVSVDLLGYIVLWLIVRVVACGEKTRKKSRGENDSTLFFCDLIQKYIPSAHFSVPPGKFWIPSRAGGHKRQSQRLCVYTWCIQSRDSPRQATRAGIPVRDRSTPSLCRTPPSCRLSPAVAPAAPHTSCSRLCSWTWRGISRTDPVRRAAHVCTGKRRGSRALGRTVSRSSPCSCRAVKAESLIEGGSGRSTTEVSTSSHVGPKNFSLHTHACATQTPLPPHGRPIASVGQSRSCSQRSPP